MYQFEGNSGVPYVWFWLITGGYLYFKIINKSDIIDSIDKR